MKKSIALSLLGTLLLSSIPIGLFIRDIGLIEYETPGIQKQVSAFYYPWYSNTTNYSQSYPYEIQDGDNWGHWNCPGYNPPANACSTNTPLQGWFDSADPSVIETHLDQAAWAGVDNFIVSYWGSAGRDFNNYQTLMRVAKNVSSPVRFAPYFEIFASMVDRTDESTMTSSLIYEFSILYDFLTEPEFAENVWFEGEMPVLFIYVMKSIPTSVWLDVQAGLVAAGKELFLVGDRPTPWSEDYSVISGAHQYDVYAPLRDNSYALSFLNLKRDCKKAGTIFAAGVSPGYDDQVVREGNTPRDREGGDTYKMTWELALGLNPDWITITSWNEWHEGTEIEPSVENGDLALNQTREFIQEFKSGEYSTLYPVNPYQIRFSLYGGSLILIWAIVGIISFISNKKNSSNLP